MKKVVTVSKILIITSLTLAIFPAFAFGDLIRVPLQSPSIQNAIASSVDGDTVLVDTGTYVENLNFLGKKIIVASNYLLTGNPFYISKTVINGSAPSDPDRASVVLFITNEDSSSVLEGFTITGGKGTVWQDHHNHNYYREGGGILTDLSSPTIRNNLIINNTANSNAGVSSSGGGGIRCSDGNPRILNNVIMQNNGRYGGGIVLNYTGALIRNNVIYKNTGGQDYGGSGIWTYASGTASKVVENNTIVENSSALDGGGILVQSTTMAIHNNIVWGNTAPTGAQISVSGGTAIVTYCDVQGGYTGSSNINAEPFFTDTSFYLAATSPCKDAGDPASTFNDREDPANPGHALFPSTGMLRNDMGAYGGPGALSNVAFTLHKNAPRPPSSIYAYSDYQTPASIKLTWIDPDSTVGGAPLSNFSIRIYRNGSFLVNVDSGKQQYIDSSLNLHQHYLYYLRAVTPTDSSRIDSASAYAGGSGIPSPPVLFTETDSISGIFLRWKNPASQTDGTPLNDFASIYIERDGIAYYSITQTSADTAQARSFFDSTQGYHYYRIYSRNNASPIRLSPQADSLLGFAGLYSDFNDDFESGIGTLYHTGTWDTTSVLADSGSFCITDSPSGNYGASTTTFILTPGVALGAGMELSFYDIAIVRNPSHCFVDISTDHRRTFTALKAYNWTAHAGWQDGIADPVDWIHERMDLSAYAGDIVTIRLRIFAGSGATADGWYIDNISIKAVPPTSISLPLRNNWNMVSLPVRRSDLSADSVFPGALSKPFTFNAGYTIIDSIRYGAGYWIKFAGPSAQPLFGLPIQSDTIAVKKGWNMIGSITDTVDTSSIVKLPAGFVVTPYYTYTDTGYAPSQTIQPGHAYWVKTSNAGSLIVSHPLSGKNSLATDAVSRKE
jgi:hypothetical protein